MRDPDFNRHIHTYAVCHMKKREATRNAGVMAGRVHNSEFPAPI